MGIQIAALDIDGNQLDAHKDTLYRKVKQMDTTGFYEFIERYNRWCDMCDKARGDNEYC